ncbi:MAG: potassium-transporting ATPase subunit C [Acidobacteriia bacterium]|nr:potassium-transporting ATPase subunit C [Terriglobia bacterium]
MWEQILPGLRIKIVMTVLLGVIYPLAMTGISQVIFPKQANGSLIKAGDKVIGSELIGQTFSKPEYFHGRPSSAGGGYDATASSGSNLGPTSAKLIHGTTKMDDKKNEVVDFDGISVRIVHYCLDNDIAYESSVPLDQFKDAKGDLDDVKLIKAFNDDKKPLVFTPKASIPADAITASASGLDPHISPDSARAQIARVAKARGSQADQVNQLVAQFTEGPDLGLLGEARVNVLKLNLALDQQFPVKK